MLEADVIRETHPPSPQAHLGFLMYREQAKQCRKVRGAKSIHDQASDANGSVAELFLLVERNRQEEVVIIIYEPGDSPHLDRPQPFPDRIYLSIGEGFIASFGERNFDVSLPVVSGDDSQIRYEMALGVESPARRNVGTALLFPLHGSDLPSFHDFPAFCCQFYLKLGDWN